MAKFQAGDTVYLKSGGPAMTVVSAERMGPDAPETVTAKWVAKVSEGTFPAECLTRDNPDASAKG